MLVSLVSNDFYPQALQFLMRFESFCVPLMERALAKKVPLYGIFDDDNLQSGSGQIRGIFSWSRGGQIFHCLPWKTQSEKDGFARALEAFLWEVKKNHPKNLFSVNGENRGTELFVSKIQEVMGKKPDHGQLYDFMKWQGVRVGSAAPVKADGGGPGTGAAGSAAGVGSAASAEAGGGGSESAAVSAARGIAGGRGPRIIACGPSLLKRLIPLQIAYEKEEVVFDLLTYSEEASILSLKKNLKEQEIFALEVDGRLASKAATNARGKNYVQLGGVFTVKEQRGKGYGKMVVSHFLKAMAALNKKVVLFVKPQNLPAIKLYLSCGFEKIGAYNIQYF